MHQINFADGNTKKNVAAASFPMLVAQLLNLLYSIVDRIYIGRIEGHGSTGLAAIGLCFPVIIMVTAFTNLFGYGGSPLCAIERGRQNSKRAEQVMCTSFSLLICTSFVLFFLFEAFHPHLLTLFGASPNLLPYASSYLTIYLLGTPATMIASGLNPFINAQGYAGAGMLTIFVGAFANLLLDPLFIFVFGLGIEGSAIATVIAQYLSMGFVLWFMLTRSRELHLHFLSPHRLELPLVLRILGLGLTNFVMQFSNSLVAIVCNSMLSAYGGDLYISVYTVVSSVRTLMDVPVGALGDGSSPVLSYNFGARKPARMKETVRFTTTICILYTAVVWGLILLFPDLFIRIFTADESLLLPASHALRIYFFAFIFQSFQYCGQTVFKSLGRSRKAIFFSLFRKVVMVVPLTLLLPRLFSLGTDGVFMAEPVSNFIGGCACFATMYLTEYRRWGNSIS